MSKFCWTLTTPSLLSLFFMILVIPLTLFLPIEWSVENGPIEWLQVALLATGALTVIGAYYFGVVAWPARRLFLCSVPVWLILIGREISWGRVFFPNGAGGFVPLKQLWYGIYVYPSIAGILICLFVIMLKSGLHNEFMYWFRNGEFPAIDVIIVITSVVGADLGEHHAAGLLGTRNVLMEELLETVAYLSLVGLAINLGFYNKFQAIVKNPSAKNVRSSWQ